MAGATLAKLVFLAASGRDEVAVGGAAEMRDANPFRSLLLPFGAVGLLAGRACLGPAGAGAGAGAGAEGGKSDGS